MYSRQVVLAVFAIAGWDGTEQDGRSQSGVGSGQVGSGRVGSGQRLLLAHQLASWSSEFSESESESEYDSSELYSYRLSLFTE